MRVGVRSARDLPQAERVRVGLASRVRIEDARDVGLGLDVHDRCGLIGAEDRRRAADRVLDSCVLARRRERQADRAAAVHEEGVERVRERLHAVVVGDERERRL